MKKILIAFVACMFTAVFVISSHGAVLNWDVNGATAPCGGTGNWSTTGTAFWSTACDTAGVNWTNTNGDSARFTVASAPTLTAPITVDNIQVDVGGVILANGANVANRFTFTGASAGVNCAHTTLATTLTAPYLGTLFTKSGPGELLLNNSTAGLTPTRWVISGGFVAIPAFSRLRSASAIPAPLTDYLTLNGGGIGTSLAASDALGPNGGVVLGAGGGFFGASNAGNLPVIDGPISGPGGLTVTGGAPFYSPYASGGIWTISNPANNYGGSTTVAAGGLTTGAAGVIPDSSAVTLSGGDLVCAFAETVKSFTLNSANSAASGAGPFTATNLPTSYTLKNGTCSLVLAGAASTALKNSASTVTLSGANTFAGGLTFSTGTLLVGNNAALGLASSPVTIANGVTLAASSVTARTLNYSYALNGDMTLGQSTSTSGSGSLTLAGSLNLGSGTRIITLSNVLDTISASITNTGGLTLKTFANSAVLSGTVISTGSGYYGTGTTVSFDDSGTGGTGATATVSTNASGGITAINITSCGSGYTNAPTITISGAGTGATGTVAISLVALSLTGANTYSGATTVSSGKLITTAASVGGGSYTLDDSATLGIRALAAGGSLAMSDLTVGNSTMEFDFARLGYPASKMVSDTGAITVNGTVAVDVKGFDTTGTATLLEYAPGLRSGAGSFTTGIIPPHMTASIIDDTANNRVLLNTTATNSLIWVSDGGGNWDINSGSLIWKLASDGTPAEYKETVQGDIVRFDDTATGTTAVNLTATLSPYRITVDNITSNYTFTGVGKISGAGNLIKSGSGEVTFGTINDYTGGTTVNAGTINLATNTVFGTGKLSIAGNSLIRSDSTAVSTLVRTVAVAIDLNANLTLGDAVNDGELTFSGVITNSGSITKVGGGTLNLTGANTFTGGLTLSAGTLRLNNNAAIGLANSPVSIANGTTLATTTTTARTLTYKYTVNGDFTLGQAAVGTAALTLAGSMNLGGVTRTISVSNTTDTISGIITNGGLVKTGVGTLILTGANTYGGGTTVSEGVLQGSTAGLQGNILNNTAVVFSQATAGTSACVISGSGNLTNSGTGNVTLTGANTYTGTTAITAGTLTINGSLASPTVAVSSGGTLGGTGTVKGSVTVSAGGSVGAGASVGLLTLTNGLNLAAGGTNVWELGTNSTITAGTDFDQIALTGGNLALGGSSRLLLKFIGTSTTPTNTDSFWQSAHTWKIISLSGTAVNTGPSNFIAIDGTNGISAGTFSTAADGAGSIILSFTPGAAPQPVINPNLVGAGTTSVQLSFSSVNGTSYTVQYKTNLNQAVWSTLTNLTASGSSTTIVDNTSPVQKERYYRVTSP